MKTNNQKTHMTQRTEKIRKTGIDIIGDAPWGTHFCQFYQTKEDLIDILVPYFKAGLENNEFCMWVTSEPLGKEEAIKAMRKAVPNFDQHLKRGQIEIVPHTEWYLKDGAFNLQRVLDAWIDKLTFALAKGYGGIRATGNTTWLEKRDWRNFADYEEKINNAIGHYHMMAICTYWLDKCGASEVIDVVCHHQFALIRREGEWALIESSERKRAEETLRESEEKWRSLVGNAPNIILIANSDGTIQFINRTHPPATIEETIGKSIYDHIEPQYHHTVRETIQHVFQTGEPGHYEIRGVGPHGTTSWYDTQVGPIKQDGQVVAVTLISTDITERKRAEKALQESEERFRRIIENAPFGYYRVGKDGLWQYVNPVWERMHGLSLDEVIGKSFEITQTEDAVEKAREYVQRALAGETITGEFSRLIREGNIGYHSFNIQPVKHGNEIVAIEGFINDITERKKTEETLKKERQRLFSVLDIMPMFVYLQAPDYSVRFTNRKFRELFGNPGSRPCYEAFYGQKEPCDPCITLRVLKTRTPQTWEWTSQNGRTYMIYEDLFPGEGDEDLVLEIGADITERKRAEEQLRLDHEIMTNINDGVYIIRVSDGVILWTSRQFEKMSGYDPGGLIGKHVSIVNAPTDRDPQETAKEIIEELNKNGIWRGEVLNIKKDGTTFWCDASVTSLTLERAGYGAVWVAVHRDITERKRAEEVLRESEEKYRKLFDEVPVGIAISTIEGKIIDVNKAQAEMMGCTVKELKGRSVNDYYVYPDKRKEMVEVFKKIGKVRDFEIQLRRKDDSIITESLNLDQVHIGGKNFLFATGRDITERKRAEEAIRESEEKYRGVVENIGIGVSLISPNMEILTLNRQMNKWFPNIDVSKKPICYQAFNNPPREKVCSYCPTFKTLQDGLVHESIAETPSGNKIINYRIVSSPIKDKNGKIIAAIEMVEDITERKKAEETLRESEERFRQLAENIDQVFWLTDWENNKLLYVNASYEKLFDRSCQSAYEDRLSWYKVMHPDDRARVRESLVKNAKLGQNTEVEYRIVRDDGTMRWVLDRNYPIHDKQGKVYRIVSIAEDITDRKRAEEELRESEEKYRELGESITDVFFAMDKDLRYTYWNKASENLTGISAQGALGKSLYDIFPDTPQTKKAEQVYLNVLRTKQPQTFVSEYHLGGKDFVFEISAYPSKDGLSVFTKDITERKKMETQLIQAERLSAVGTLAYGIAHEFNNILAGILGNAEFGMGNDDPQEMRECFQIIMEGCDRAKNITNSLLAFSRRHETKKQRADVTPAVETILGLVERELEKHNIKVVRKFNPIPQIVCDLGELSGVVLNMITNSRDAMRPKGGTLTIEIGEKDDNIEMIFTDTGCGIPDSIKSKIFEPFVTTKGALGQSEIPGTGLGLFLSYGIISRYHGEINVQSKVGKGSKFTIRIPISKNQTEPALIETAENKPTDVPQNLNILLVDEERPVCTAIKKFFEAKGHSVTTALSGKKGLKVFKKGEFDLVLADIIMPDMDGVELISKLKEIDDRVKLIVLTGQIVDEKLEKAKKAGADQILMKPFRNEELYQVVGKVLTV
jgi:PAS domain S-box-containing protein